MWPAGLQLRAARRWWRWPGRRTAGAGLFWIAWLDGGGELRLTSFEVATGVLVQYELPGWQPSGPEAFELVTRGNETVLVLLSPAGLDLLTICS